MDKKEILFPYEEIRKEQDILIHSIKNAVNSQENLVVHAPTGLGKTVASLGPAMKKAEEEDLTIFFLTSRHTQHKIAVETLREIKKKHNLKIPIVDIIGKKWMCLQPGIDVLSSGEFSEYCRKVREDEKCEFYTNVKNGNKLTMEAKKALSEINNLSPLEVQEVIKYCEEEKLCPYEVSLLMAKKAKVIVADYYYIFSSGVMKNFFQRAEIELEDSIIIVDEAHNLPERIRNLLTVKISTYVINQARKEAERLGRDDCYVILDEIQAKLIELIDMDEERVVKKGEFDVANKEDTIDLFEELAEITREEQKRSYLGVIANFLAKFKDEEGYVNIIRHVVSNRGERIELTHICLDPSILTGPIFKNCHSSIVMSGTLAPVKMFNDILGIEGEELELPSPFPERNKLNLIIPNTTTKYSERNKEQYQTIAKTLAKVCNKVPGNTAVFFPSYYLRDNVYHIFSELCEKTVFNEIQGMTKNNKEELLDKFKSYKKSGAVLLGVASGSFGEGIDLPGDLLKCVVIVGLPLNRPNLETQALIKYYDNKYSKGWDYGYVLPAISKVFQNAGRCIRSETDKGVIVFMDKRYGWPNYQRCFSEECEVSMEYEDLIERFFKGKYY